MQAATKATRPPLEGTLRFDEPARRAAADDFGHLVRRAPQAVLLPASAADIAATLRWAAQQGLKATPRGRGHSVFGRSQVQDGVVIDMAQRARVHEVQRDRVVVEAGTTWSAVLAATLPRGLAPPVLTDYLDLSVGGTLAVGGVGAMSSRAGLQSDNVLALDVVSGDGRMLRCSRDHEAELFHMVLAGLGQVAVITHATLALVTAPRAVRRFWLTYPDLQAMLGDARRLAADDRFDTLQGAVVAAPGGGWTFRLDAAKTFGDAGPPRDDALLAGLSDQRARIDASTLPYLDYLQRLAPLERALRANGQWWFPHPWLTTFVGDSNAEVVVAAELARLTPADLGPFGQVVLSPLRRCAVASPLLRLPADDLCWVFNLIRVPQFDDAVEAVRQVTSNRALYERLRDARGTLYPASALPMTADDWRRHFGPVFERLRLAKRSFDPRHVLTPGYEVFQDQAHRVAPEWR